MCVRVRACALVGEWVGVGWSWRRREGWERAKKRERRRRGEVGGGGVALSFFWVTRPLFSLQRPCRNKRISFEWRFFSCWYFTANISGKGMCISFQQYWIREWFWWRGIQYSHLSPHAAFCNQCGILSMTAPPPPTMHPHLFSNSFAFADDISKELLAPYEAGWGKRRLI